MSTLLKVISQCMAKCMARQDLCGQTGQVGFEPTSFPPELETSALHRMASPVKSIHCPLKGSWSQQPCPRQVPRRCSWGLRASTLVFNKEDEFT